MDLLAWLQAEHRSFTPESKLLWLKVGRRYGVDTPVCTTIKKLSAELRLGDRFVMRAINDSTRIQGVEGALDYKPLQISLVAKSRGRPKSRYLATPWPKPSKTTFAELGEGREDLIERILFKTKRTAFKDRGFGLSPVNCLLLALLVSLAGSCGGVRGVSRADIRAMTGMSNERLDNQLKKLRKLGYLLGWIGGGTGRHILGVRVGVYWLHLQRCGKDFGVDVSPPRSFPILFSYYEIGQILTHKEVARRELPIEVDKSRIPSVFWLPVRREMVHLFADEPGGRLAVVLQQELENASTWIAERILLQGADYSPKLEGEAFHQKYHSVFLPSSVDTSKASYREEVMSYLFRLCRAMAGEVVRLIYQRYQTDQIAGKAVNLAIAPSADKEEDSRRLLVRIPPHEVVDQSQNAE